MRAVHMSERGAMFVFVRTLDRGSSRAVSLQLQLQLQTGRQPLNASPLLVASNTTLTTLCRTHAHRQSAPWIGLPLHTWADQPARVPACMSIREIAGCKQARCNGPAAVASLTPIRLHTRRFALHWVSQVLQVLSVCQADCTTNRR